MLIFFWPKERELDCLDSINDTDELKKDLDVKVFNYSLVETEKEKLLKVMISNTVP